MEPEPSQEPEKSQLGTATINAEKRSSSTQQRGSLVQRASIVKRSSIGVPKPDEPDRDDGTRGVTDPKKTDPLREQDVNPVKRSCTDACCCILFFVAFISLTIVHIDSFCKVSPFRITRPFDHAGNACGIDDMKDFPYVYYPAKTMSYDGPLGAKAFYLNPENRWGVCTKMCPTSFTREDRDGMCMEGNNTCTWYAEDSPKLYLHRWCLYRTGLTFAAPDASGTICTSAHTAVSDVLVQAYQSLDNMKNASAYYYQYVSEQVSSKHHQSLQQMNDSLDQRVATYKKAIDNVAENSTEHKVVQVCADLTGQQKSPLTDFISDVMNGSTIVIGCLSFSLLVGFVYLLLVCYFAKAVVWGSLFFCLIAFSLAGWLFWNESINVADTGLMQQGNEEKILAVICWLCAFMCLVCGIVARKSLMLGIALSKVTPSFLFKNKGIFLMPLLVCFLELAWILYWFLGLAGILSMAKVKPAPNVNHEYNRVELDGSIWAKIVFHLLMGFWVHEFLEALEAVTTSICVTEWYFRPRVLDKKPKTTWYWLVAMRKAVFHHMGSMAFGALVLAISNTMRVLIQLYEEYAKHAGSFRECLLAGYQCCMGMMHSCLQYLSYSAYIMIGVTGKNFCASAWEAYTLAARNMDHFAVFTGVMWTVSTIGRVFITGSGMALGALLLNKSLLPSVSEDVRSPWPPLLIIAVLGYCISGIIVQTYTTSGAALFFCFVIDKELAQKMGRDWNTYAPDEFAGLLDAEATKYKESDVVDEPDP